MEMGFKYYMPTTLYFGKNILYTQKEIFKKLGKKGYIITYEMSMGVKNQPLEDVVNILKELDISYEIETGIEPNPSTETITRISEKIKKMKVDFLIAIGGGSPIDATKAIGVLLKNPQKSSQDLFIEEDLKSIPIVAIPTTAGTGAEVTHWSVLTRNDIGTKQAIKPKIFPQYAFADPSYLLGMPLQLTRATALDALSHCIESYVSTAGNLLSRHLCEIGFTMFAKTVEAMKSGEFSYDIREIQMMVSLMGGFANAQTGTSLAHGMSYALTHEKGIPHGLACGLLIKNYLDIFKDKSRVNRIMTLCGFSSLEDFGKFIDDILILDIDISEEEIEKYSIEFAAQKHRFLRHPEPVGIEEIRRIYKNSLLRYR